VLFRGYNKKEVRKTQIKPGNNNKKRRQENTNKTKEGVKLIM
jgi:hypothetical protein